MTPVFPKLTAWSDHPRLDIDDFLDRFPAVETAANSGENNLYSGDIREDAENLEFILISGDVSISQEQVKEMQAALEEDWSLRFAVDGNVHVDGAASDFFFISGDLHCNSLWIDKTWASYAVCGRAYARDCVFAMAEDEGWIGALPATRIDTPFLFMWNYGLDTIDLNPDAVVFFLGFEWGGCPLPNRCYDHNEVVHVIDSRFLTPFTCEYTEEIAWDSGAIARALRAGESIYRPGFDIRCAEPMRAAAQAMKDGDFRQGYFLSRQAAAIAPGYYTAHACMAHAMGRAGAYAQAFDVFVEASQHFPPEQTGLVNEALNYAARYAMRLGWLDLAHDLATQSIDFTRVSDWNDQLLTEAYWIRAETCIAQGDVAAAERDLTQSLRFDKHGPQPNWLMGLLCFQRGEHKQARDFYAKAARRWTQVAYYDVASTYLQGFNPVSVDWDQLGPALQPPA